jgi:hypothetical protein
VSSSHPKSGASDPSESLENCEQIIASNRQARLFDGPLPGSLNDEALVRSVLIVSIKAGGKSRPQIADEMSELLGISVTERMLNAFTAESKELHRWPGAWDRAFCEATGDNRLLCCRLNAAGLRVITPEEEKLLELGRQYLRRKRAEKRISSIEQDFEGFDL